MRPGRTKIGGSGKNGDTSDVRQRVLSSALSLFDNRGYAATSVREIVEAAGVTKPVLYYYFGSKEGIYLELMRDAQQRFEDLLDKLEEQAGTVPEKLTALCERMFALFVERIQMVRVMYAMYYGPPQGAPFVDFEAFHTRLRQTILTYVREGMGAEFVKGKPEDISLLVLSVLNLAMEMELTRSNEGVMGKGGLSRALALVFQGLA